MTTYELIESILSNVIGAVCITIVIVLFFRSYRDEIRHPDYKEIKLKRLKYLSLMETQKHERKMKKLEK